MTTTLDHRRTVSLTPLPRAVVRPAPASSASGGDRRDRLGRALSELFAARDDLGGVSTVADVLAEDLLWSV